jgi:hypothetical protein
MHADKNSNASRSPALPGFLFSVINASRHIASGEDAGTLLAFRSFAEERSLGSDPFGRWQICLT